MKRYEQKIPLETDKIKMIIRAIENADYLYENDMIKENFPTDNGSGGTKWNYINREIKKILGDGRYQIEVLCCPPWKFLGIFDRKTGYLYTLMREKNLLNLRNHREAKLFHYTNVLSRLNDNLNGKYVIENEQMCLFPDMLYDESGKENLDQRLNKLIKKIDGSIRQYVLVSFDIFNGQVTAIKGTIPSIGMDYYKEESWTDLLSASYFSNNSEAMEKTEEDVIVLECKPDLRRRKKEQEKKQSK